LTNSSCGKSSHSCTKQAKELHSEIKTTKEIKKKQLEEMRSTQDCFAPSGEYAIDCTNNDMDRNVYHGKCLIGPHIQRLLDNQVKILEELETAFVAVRALTIVKHPGADHCASIEEMIVEEMAFFSEVLQCYDVCFALLRQTRDMFTVEEIAELQHAIDKLQHLWPTQRNWEEKEASVTPKLHNLWFKVVPQLA
jgi:hypothetical protein